MEIIKSVKRMVALSRKIKAKGKRIGFVATMGYLHEGHLSLVRKARRDCDVVIMSIYVNPIQFGPKEDFKRYPRDLRRDKRLARIEGVDVVFIPSDRQMYPPDYQTYVNVEKVTMGLCGRSRPGHFRGVTTVVTKLFNIVRPDIAYFGQKDAQQARVIEKMVEDLNMDIKIKVLPIVREPSGVAMSSRNLYLTPQERKDALVLFQSLNVAKKLIKEGELDSKKIIKIMKSLIRKKKTAKIDYVEIVDTKTLESVEKIKGDVLVALAVWIGNTRLIDNMVIKPKRINKK